jgi:predicted metal-dependent HD superfamily phosphohydrolase
MNIERWLRLMSAWSFGPNEDTYRALVAAYSEKHRHYHTAEHIEACLKHVDVCIAQMDNPHEVELALWFHDAIYEPFSGDNEKKSADWAASFLKVNGAASEATSRVYNLIMVTVHSAPTQTNDESILVDIDLSILGVSESAYDAFEHAVRREYKLVPNFIFNKKRAEILRGFLDRDRIYQNEPFHTEREQQARVNLANAVSRLR